MQTHRKFKWALLAGFLVVTTATFFGLSTKTAYADYGTDVSSCTYEFTVGQTEIDRTNCGSKADLTFTKSGSDYQEVSSHSKCTQTIKVASGGTSGTLSGKYEDTVVAQGRTGTKTTYPCKSFKSVSITIAQGTSTGGSSTTSNSGDTCESNGAGALTWMICPIVEGLQNAVAGIYDGLIQPLLYTEPLDKNTTTGNQIYQAWSNFRIYGDVFLVIAVLVIVFGESLGGGLIDAYTAKKVLPRLLAAAVLINISWYLVAVLVDIMNIVGGGLQALITAPFGLNNGSGFDLDFNGTGSNTMGLVLSGAVVYGAITGTVFSFIPWFWAVVLLPMLLIFLAILIVVLLRRALIVFLVIISPVALALYCLPNTEKYFRQWWDTLFKTLLVYPIIASLFALGKVSAYLINHSGDGKLVGAVAGMVSIVALVVPLMLIPFAFKIAGGVIGRAYDAVGGVQKRAHAMGQSRRDQARKRFAYSRASRASKGIVNPLDKVIGKTIGRGAFNPIGYAIGAKKESTDQRLRTMGAELAKTEGAEALKHDDLGLRAAHSSNYFAAVKDVRDDLMEQGMGKEEATREAKRAARAAQAATGFGTPQAIWAAQAITQTGTGINDIEDMVKLIDRASGGNASTRASLVGNMNAMTKGVGRHDLAPSFAVLNELATAKATGATEVTIEGKTVSLDEGYRIAHQKAWESASLYQHANDKSKNLKAAVKHFAGELNSGDPKRVQAGAVFLSELKAMSPNATGDAKVVIDEALKNYGGALDQQLIDPATGGPALKPVVRRDPTDPNKLINDTAPITLGESVASRVRQYERPDPNTM